MSGFPENVLVVFLDVFPDIFLNVFYDVFLDLFDLMWTQSGISSKT